MTKKTNESTSTKVAKIASKGLRDPSSLTNEEIRKISASTLTQKNPKSSGGKRK